MIDTRSIDGALSRLVQSVNSGEWNPVTETDRFRVAREQTLAMLDQVSAAQALWSPPGGKWTIAQIADHLLRSEEMYREQFRRLIEKGAPIDISLAELDYLPKKAKPAVDTLRFRNMHAVAETWLKTHKRLDLGAPAECTAAN